MKKAIIGLMLLVALSVGVSAITEIGDTVTFTVEPHPDAMVCDHDMSDDLGVWFYGGYALQDPDGIIITSTPPVSLCDTYIPSYDYTLTKAGTYKFCAKVWELDVSYLTETCSGDYKEAEKCMTVSVIECDNDNFEQELLGFFNVWIDTW